METLHAFIKILDEKPEIKTIWALSENAIRELAGSAENFPECPVNSKLRFPAQLKINH